MLQMGANHSAALDIPIPSPSRIQNRCLSYILSPGPIRAATDMHFPRLVRLHTIADRSHICDNCARLWGSECSHAVDLILAHLASAIVYKR